MQTCSNRLVRQKHKLSDLHHQYFLKVYIIIQQKNMGKKIENYCLQQVIGEGEFGKVYRSINEKTQQTVAIKVIKIEKFKMSPKLQQFTINEIQTLSKLEDTTHIVKFIEILKTANNYYFVYEYCNGGTLQQLIKLEGRLTQEKALIHFKDLLKAFKTLIKGNIMHRDIKPSNILLQNGIIKLADFGFCKPLKDARDLAQTMLGSPIYMAPQILKGQAYTMKADIWSLGVVLYQMLYGFCPFQERTIARLINLIQESAVNFPTHIKVSKKVEDLMRKMLVKDQFKRISWQQLFDYDFNASPAASEAFSRNPFMKKQNYSTSIEESRNPLANITKNTNREVQYSSKKYQTRKTQNSPQNNQQVKTQKKMVKSLLDKRTNIYKGIKMVQDYLTQSSSKLTVYICCYIMKKVQALNKEISDMVSQMNKQNVRASSQIKKIFTVLMDQKLQIEEKVKPFEQQLSLIVEPQDIVYLKYAQQESLTQQKQGLIQLLEIDDYLNGVSGKQYNRGSKKQLFDDYQKRVLSKT